MINSTIIKVPAYTTRDFRNFGLHYANKIYDYRFMVQDIALLNSGAIKLFPKEMCDFITAQPAVLLGKKYDKDEKVDIAKFDDKTLNTLLKVGILKQEFKEDFKDLNEDQLVKTAQLYETVGQSFKQVSENFGLDFDKVKEACNLKQGASIKKVKSDDIQTLQKLLEV